MQEILQDLKQTLDSYYPLSTSTWQAFLEILSVQEVKKNQSIFAQDEHPNAFYYVYKGLFRSFSVNEHAEEYSKVFFAEKRFFGAMAALLSCKRIESGVEALEDGIIVRIDFQGYRKLLVEAEDLKLLHIYYLEKHWIIEKKDIEYSLVLEDASTRYQRFLQEYAHLTPRLSQHHVATYLGITPTHLSRIRKKLKKQH